MRENKHIIVMVFLAKQGLPFRGDVEDLSLRKNPGNFLALFKYFAETDAILSNHLNNPGPKMHLPKERGSLKQFLHMHKLLTHQGESLSLMYVLLIGLRI